MVSLTALWLPILLSAVVVFVASSVLHMVLTYHRKDYAPLPGEAKILEAMRREGVGPGHYYMPYCVSPKEMAEPATREKFEQGPVGFLTVLPRGLPNMAKPLISWFVYLVVINLVVAYLTGRTVAAGADYLSAFRVAGTAALLGYAGSTAAESIWRGQPWSNTFRSLVDGLIYSLLTAGVFGWLWPGA